MRQSRATGGTPKRSDRETVVTLRLPRELHERLKGAAGERGLAAHVRERLEASLTIDEAWDTPNFANLFRAIGYLAVSASRIYPDDPDAYPIVDLAIRQLLDVFRPEAAKDIIYEIYVPTTVELVGKAERLLGVALGALGDIGHWAGRRSEIRLAGDKP